MKGRAIRNADAGGAVEIELVRNLDQSVGADDDPLARSSVSHVADYPVACLECRNSCTQAFDSAGEFGGRRKRRGRLELVFAGDDQSIEKVQRRGVDSNRHLAGAWLRLGNIGQLQIIGPAG